MLTRGVGKQEFSNCCSQGYYFMLTILQCLLKIAMWFKNSKAEDHMQLIIWITKTDF